MRPIPPLLLALALAAPAFADGAVVVGVPRTFLYDRAFGIEKAALPAGTEVETLGVERLFTRVRYKDTIGYVANAQLASKSLVDRQKATIAATPATRLVRVSAARPIPLYADRQGAVLRRIEPGWVLPVESEDAYYLAVRFIDERGLVLKTDVEPWRDRPGFPFRIEAEPAAVTEIDFRLVKADNPVYAFLVSAARHFGRSFPDAGLERKARYTGEEVTFADLTALLAYLGLTAEPSEPVARIGQILADFRGGRLLLFRLRLDGRFRYLLLLRVEPATVKLLDVIEAKGYQLSLREFTLLATACPVHLRIRPTAE